MPYVPGCRSDLFISYATDDDVNEWVSQFKVLLGRELKGLLGGQFSTESIYFAPHSLRVGTEFPEALDLAAAESAVLVAILSPSFLTSRWCSLERTAFLRRGPDGSSPDRCIVPVQLRPVDDDDLDEVFRQTHRVQFFNTQDGRPWPAGSHEWCEAVRKLADEIQKRLKAIRQAYKPVFVGRVPIRQQRVRERCVDELEARSFRVSPKNDFQLEDAKIRDAALSEAALALHFIGGSDRITLESIDRSVVLCKGPTVIYQPFGVELTYDERACIEGLSEADRAPQLLVEKNEQDLLAFLSAELTRWRGSTPAAGGEDYVALLCGKEDLQLASSLAAALEQSFARGRIRLPDLLNDGNSTMQRLRQAHECLRQSTKAVFCWKSTKQNFLHAVWTNASTYPTERRAWYLIEPDIERKETHVRALPDSPRILRDQTAVIAFISQ
jgi:hypothetical protein